MVATRPPRQQLAIWPKILLIVGLASSAADTWAREEEDEQPLDEIIVTATRSPGFVRDEPIRIEAVPAEEIEENLTIQPGNVSKLLKELPGVYVQSSAPALGGAAMQLRGLPGRNTLVLTDGLPLLGAEPDAFGLLQTPPLDLARAEVIKGAATALYGSSALGGALNLVSRTPEAEPGFLVNVTSRGGADLAGFLTASGASPWSGTLTLGMHNQTHQDVDRDGWADLPDFRRYTLRPRVWWQGDGASLMLTAGAMDEVRRGGTMPGDTLPDGRAFAEALRTRRYDVGAVSQSTVADAQVLSGRYSYTSTDLNRTFGGDRVSSRQSTAYLEESLSGTSARHRWVLGLAYAHDSLAADDVPGVGYTYDVPAAFGQDTYMPVPWLTLAASARVDAHSDYGTYFSPRVSALLRKPEGPWSLRASVGSGFTVPTPFVDEVAATWLGALLPIQGLHAERATSASLDAKWADDGWDLNLSVFTSEIRDALQVVSRPGDRLQLVNAAGPRRAPGVELLVGYSAGPLQAIASWSAIQATELDDAGKRHDAAGVPRQTASLDAIVEDEKRGRIGIELEYTGRQALDDNPYRDSSPGYWQVSLLGEMRIGEFALFLNAVNLTDERQTHWDALVRPTPGPGGDPITGAWAPLDGRVFNLGLRGEF
jgi:iron complex outermembrane receptor protein